MGGRHPKELRRQRARKHQRTRKADHDTDEDRARSLAQDHPENFAGAGAERNAHSNFASAAAHEIGHHSIYTRRSEQERSNSKEADENDIKAARTERRRIDLRERTESRRNVRVEVVEDSARFGRDHLRVCIAEHGYGNCRARALEQIDIDGGTRRRIDAVITNISDDADDGKQAQIAIHVAELDGVADGILAGPAFAGKRFADDSDVRRIRAIVRVKDATTNERNLQNLEVAICSNTEIGGTEAFFLLG